LWYCTTKGLTSLQRIYALKVYVNSCILPSSYGSGYRSNIPASILRQAGYSRVKSLGYKSDPIIHSGRFKKLPLGYKTTDSEYAAVLMTCP
jgi:hypothetical protein